MAKRLLGRDVEEFLLLADYRNCQEGTDRLRLVDTRTRMHTRGLSLR